jgi:hypothetical protein
MVSSIGGGGVMYQLDVRVGPAGVQISSRTFRGVREQLLSNMATWHSSDTPLLRKQSESGALLHVLTVTDYVSTVAVFACCAVPVQD